MEQLVILGKKQSVISELEMMRASLNVNAKLKAYLEVRNVVTVDIKTEIQDGWKNNFGLHVGLGGGFMLAGATIAASMNSKVVGGATALFGIGVLAKSLSQDIKENRIFNKNGDVIVNAVKNGMIGKEIPDTSYYHSHLLFDEITDEINMISKTPQTDEKLSNTLNYFRNRLERIGQIGNQSSKVKIETPKIETKTNEFQAIMKEEAKKALNDENFSKQREIHSRIQNLATYIKYLFNQGTRYEQERVSVLVFKINELVLSYDQITSELTKKPNASHVDILKDAQGHCLRAIDNELIAIETLYQEYNAIIADVLEQRKSRIS